jgi:two-component system sensor histidine kinase KdpD
MEERAELPELPQPPKGYQAPGRDRLLVCLGPSPLSLRLIRATQRIAHAQGLQWYALYVETPGHERLPAEKQEIVTQALLLASQLGAQVVKVSGFRIGNEILTFARENQVTRIFVGKPSRGRWRSLFGGSLVDHLIWNCGPIDVSVISGEVEAEEEKLAPAARRAKVRLDLKGYTLAAAGVGVCTAVTGLLFPYLTFTSLVMLYLFTVAVVSACLSRGPAIFSACASVAAFAFFFVPEYWSFKIAHPEYAITLVVMLVVSALISELTARLRYQARVARRQERQTAALYDMNQRLAASDSLDTLLATAVEHISQVFDGQVSILLPGPDGELHLAAGPALPEEDVREAMVARWVYRYGHSAGAGTGTLSAVRGLFVPLVAMQQPVGILRLQLPQPDAPLAADALPLLEALGRQLGLAMERDKLFREAREAQLEIEAERMRNTLLSSVSHDLKTPLTVIAGSASTLLEGKASLDYGTQMELAHTIYDEANRLDLLVRNLLEMSRLQSGQIRLNKEWHVLEEVIGSALHQLEPQLQEHPLKIDLPADLPLVNLDALLIERVLINLLDNAIKYTPAGTPVAISGGLQDQEVVLAVADAGPGLPSGKEARIFEKFFQATPGSTRGVGLGLSICRSIIEAHRGRIWVANRPGGGAVFSFTLPLEEGAPRLEPDLAELKEEPEHEAAHPAR